MQTDKPSLNLSATTTLASALVLHYLVQLTSRCQMVETQMTLQSVSPNSYGTTPSKVWTLSA